MSYTKATKRVTIPIFIMTTLLLHFCNLYSAPIEADRFNCPFDFSYKHIDFGIEFKGLSEENITQSFPHRMYLDSTSWWNFRTIETTFTILNSSQSVSYQKSEEVMRSCLIDSLLLNGWNRNLDSLELLLTYSERYFNYAEANPKMASFFGQVADAWCSHVAMQLGELAKSDIAIKESFKFRYIAEHCRCLAYPPNIRPRNSEKAVNNLIEGNYKYLWNRFSKGTSITFRLLVFFPTVIFLLVFAYGCICIMQKHLVKQQN
jgi:hypothetical protein